ncbi:MAG: DUF2804 domain-containing protein [Dehalococcoidia bacterium]|nr:DUF2804 domain-containing protein [Dehalococcoidia bacterium]
MAEYVQRELLPAPDSLVTSGKFNFGTFKSQFRRVNPLDAHNPLGFPLPGPLLSARLKEWQAFQLGNNRWFMLAVLYNAKVSALAQFIVYDKENRKKYTFEKVLPSWQVKVPDSIWNSSQSYRDRECMIEIVSLLEKGRFYINIKLHDQKNLPDMEANFEMFHDEGSVEPIVVSIPFGKNRGMYSHKCLMPMQGTLALGDEKIDFVRRESFAFIDDHKGFYPYVMKYDWATAAGFDDRGQLTGFNLTDNQSLDAEKYNENCLWINGRLHLLPPVKFSRPDGVESEWLIRDSYGMVDLTFKPVSMGIINMNLLFLRVDYKGPFGYCNGFIRDSAGNKVLVNQYFGMGEDKYIRG